MPTGFVRAVVDRVIPSLLAPTADGSAPAAGPGRGVRLADDADMRRQHVTATVTMLHDYSASLAAAVAEGRTAIVGVEYTLADGTANLVHQIGEL